MQWDGKFADHTFFLPTLTLNYDITPLHNFSKACETWEHSWFSVMWSRQLSVFPEDHFEQTLNPEVSWEWAHSWTLQLTPRSLRQRGRNRAQLERRSHSSGTFSLQPSVCVTCDPWHVALGNPTLSHTLLCLTLLGLLHPWLEFRGVTIGLHLNKHIWTTERFNLIQNNVFLLMLSY